MAFKKNICPVFILCFMLNTIVYGQTSYDYSNLRLEEAIEIGQKNNLKLKMRVVDEAVAENREKVLKDERLPEVNFSSGLSVLSNLRQYEQGFFNPSTKYEIPRFKYDFTLSAEISLYNGSLLKNEEKKAAIETGIAQLRTKKNERELRLEIYTAYLHIWHLQAQQALIVQQMKEDQINIKQVKSLQQNGVVTNNEVLRTSLQLSNHKMSERELSNEILIIEHQLETLLGIEESIQIEPLSSSTQLSGLTMVENELTKAYESNENLLMAQSELQLRELDKKINHAKVLPQIMLEGEYGLNYPNFLFFPPEEYLNRNGAVGIRLKIPLTNYYKNRTTKQLANQGIELAKLEIEEQKENIRHSLFAAEKRYEDATQRMTIAREAIEQAQENYRIVKIKYANKLSLITELIDADNASLEAQSNLIALEIDRRLKYYQLNYIIGNL